MIAAWNRFWFDSRSNSSLLALGLFRLVFCSVLFVCYLSRAFDLEPFYTENGFMPSAFRRTVEAFAFRPTFLDHVQSLYAIHAFHTLFLLCMLLLALGLFTRMAALATYFLHLTFLNRNMGVMFGVDTISTFFLLYLCFANSGARYSLDARWWKKREKQTTVGHIAWRLMQIQVCVIYAYSGLSKLQGVRWWDGSAFWDVLSAGNLQRWDMSFVAHVPILLATVVYLVLLWEIYFPVLVWLPKFRLPILFFGFLMHIGIFLFLSLPGFGFMMIALYLLFLKKEEIESGLKALRMAA